MTSPTKPPACTGCTYRGPRCVCHVPRRRALLLLNLGTPDDTSVPAVKRYLREFLSDDFVIKLPGFWRVCTPWLARVIAHFRGPKSAKAYASIWWDEGSPLKVITENQVAKIQARLGKDWDVRYAMRYANPSIRDVVAAMAEDGVTELTVVPMYPQFAGPTTGTALERLYAELRRQGLRWSVTVRGDWYDDRAYIESQSVLIAEGMRQRGLTHHNAFLLFSTHSMPTSYVKEGDPYEGQVRRSMELVRRRLGWPEDRMALSFQSKLGPIPWLSPSTEDVLEDLAERGEKNVVVCPISFTADCLETLEEIGDEYAELFAVQAEEHDGEKGKLHLLPAVNDDDRFIEAVAGLAWRGPQRMSLTDPIAPLADSSDDENLGDLIDRLRVLTVAVPGELERVDPTDIGRAGSGYLSSDRLRDAGREREHVLDTVRATGDTPGVDGCVWLTTCRRSELYALATRGSDGAEAERALRERLPHAEAKLLSGREAYRHLLTVALGLKSVLPGDRDVTEQVRSSARMSAHAGGVSPGLQRLFDTAADNADRAFDETAWSEFVTDFGDAALHELGVMPSNEDACVVIGGSTTGRQLLTALSDSGHDARMTFAYRGKGRKDLVRFVRKVAPGCRRLRVERYDNPLVTEAVAEADVVFFGIDTRRPVLSAAALEPRIAKREHPLLIIDFNTHGSTEGLETLPGVRLIRSDEILEAARRHGRRMVEREGFVEALAEVKRYVETASCAMSWCSVKRECERGPCSACPISATVDRLHERIGGKSIAPSTGNDIAFEQKGVA
ncbi:MAG: ferrochelatase [Planctomycetota bacterium]